ncbi:MAG: FtsQ-type POTRA domain-containing protein [Leptolyngbya sp. RL_3_1]|nr:FtsQ-type POTRA domain-containing protein [Leptolyngbya sp. RL_3_1]
MTELVSPSPENLASRRQDLRRQRRRRNLQGLWRGSVVVGLAIAGLWGFHHPRWFLQDPTQVAIEGNQHLSDAAIQSLLPLDYPQSLLAVEPAAIVQVLQAQAPISDVQVARQLFPPSLTVTVQERAPVAVTRADPGSDQADGFLDIVGRWLPEESFTLFEADWSPPPLTVEGYRDTYRSQWPGLYATLQAAPIEVSRVDWRDPSNLILHTELGQIYVGSYGAQRLPSQLRTLAQLRPLITADTQLTVDYIDLRDPDNPIIQAPGPLSAVEDSATR